jgi:D-glycero-alpha-D-manno-heptose-7-phosphate kinase
MVITKTPIRVSFLGGGSDYPEHFLNFGGQTISVGINKYSYISVKKRSMAHSDKILLQYNKTEKVDSIDDIEHPSFRECLRYMNCCQNIEIHYTGDLPARTGLGSSSSFTVGLLHALHAYQNISITQDELASLAVFIEREKIIENVGYQDQYAAAISGLLHLNFRKNSKVKASRVNLRKERVVDLESHMMLFYTGIQRYSSQILGEQINKTLSGEICDELEELSSLVYEGLNILKSNLPITNFGVLLDKSWDIKRALSSLISNSFIDNAYSRALKAGASGGKLLGAGGGGFLLLVAKPDLQKNIEKELDEMVRINIKIDFKGSQLIYKELKDD